MRENILCKVFFVFITWVSVSANSRIDPLVHTKVGLISGLKSSDGDYSMFLGIPYAKVNEDNPFGSSITYPPFNDTFEAYEDSATCPQMSGSTPIGTLDCLQLNIYVPSSANSRNRLPVLVWIHGGGFETGSADKRDHDPKFLVRHDIIIVLINYRLGVYGFMCLDIPEVPGNQGLKDQLLALRWIKNNIEAFGGDLNKITIAGSSAGAKSTDYHLHLTKEIPFRSVILQSGTVLLPQIPELGKISDPTAPLLLAEILGLSTNNLTQALSFLSRADPASVIAAGTQLENFVPCYEKEFENVESFVTDYSINLDTANIRGKNIMLGFTFDEWLYMHAPRTAADYVTWNGFRNNLNSYFNFEEDELTEMTDTMRHFYIGDENISIDVRSGLIDFDSDFLFNYPCERSIDKFLESEAASVYYYLFSYIGERNWAREAFNITYGGASHAEELGYLFDNYRFSENNINSVDQLMIDRITTLWANFVKYGDPTPETSELLPVKWEPVTRDSPRYYLDIGSELELGKRPFNERMAFWELFYNRNEKLQRGYREN